MIMWNGCYPLLADIEREPAQTNFFEELGKKLNSPENEAFFDEVDRRHLQDESDLRYQFIGHERYR